MTANQINAQFLASISASTRTEILSAIAKHYGTNQERIVQEVTGKDAEHLLEYLVEPTRTATAVLMRRNGF